MTLLAGWLDRGASKATTLAVRDDIIMSDRIIGELGSMWGSIALDADYTATYEEIAKRQLWVRIAINKIAYGIGRIPLKTFDGAGENERERVRDNQLVRTLRRPNTTKATGTTPGLIARAVYDLMMYSNSLIVKGQIRPDRPVDWLLPYAPLNWRIDGDTYIHTNPYTREETRVPSWRMIHIVEPGPTMSGFGVSRLEAARLTLAIEYAAQRLGVATFQNGARPGGIINVKNLPQGQGRADAVERFKAEVLRRFGGSAKAGLPAVLEGDTTWLPMSHNLDDSAVVQHRQLTREEVAALYDIPQPAIGILDEANFASVDMLHIMFYQDTLGWPIRLIEESLNAQLVEGVPEYDGLFVEFDMNAVMRGDPAARAAYYTAATGRPWMVTDEARHRENLPPLGGDAARLVTPLNLSTGNEQTQEV